MTTEVIELVIVINELAKLINNLCYIWDYMYLNIDIVIFLFSKNYFMCTHV